MKAGKRVLQQLRALARAYEGLLDASAGDMRLNRTDRRALEVVASYSGLTAGELATRLQITSGATTRVVGDLVKAGLATRVEDKEDRRRMRIEATPAGEAAHRRTWEPLAMRLSDLLEPYSDADRETVLGFLLSASQALAPDRTGVVD